MIKIIKKIGLVAGISGALLLGLLSFSTPIVQAQTANFWTQNAVNSLATNTSGGLANADIHVKHCYIGLGTGTPCGGSGGGVTSLNTLTGAVTISAGSGITLTPAGNNIAIAASGGGTPALPEFHIPYGDASNLMTSSSLLQYSPAGRLNVDFTGVHPSLDIDLSAGSYQFGDYAQQTNGTHLSIDDTNRQVIFSGKYAGLGFAPGLKLDFANQTFGLGDITGAANGTNVFVSDATQKVGINTVNPQAALHVQVLEQPIIQAAVPAVGNSGSNDITSGGTMSGNATSVIYTVTTSAGDPTSPNEFHWSGNDGTAGDFVCDGSAQAVGSYGVTVMFSGCGGHATGDSWTIAVTQPAAFWVQSTQGTVPLTIQNDGTMYLQNAGSGNDVLAFDPTGGSIGSFAIGDTDLGTNHGLLGWKQTDVADPTKWEAYISGTATAGHGGGGDEDFFSVDQNGLISEGDTHGLFTNPGTAMTIDPINEAFNFYTGGNGTGSGSFKVLTSAYATSSPVGYSNLLANPGDLDLFAAGDWNQTRNKTALYVDDSAQTINNKTDGTFNVIGSTSNKTLLAIDGTNEQSTFRSAVFMYNGTPFSNAPIFMSGNGDAKVVIGDAFNNYDSFTVTTDPTTSTANGSSGDLNIHGFHGGIGYFYTDGITFSKPLSQSYGLQTFTPVSGRLDVGTNTATVTSATTLTLLGTSTASGSQWVEGAQITLILNGGPLVRNNQSPAAGYAPMILTGGVDYQSNPSDIMTFVYNGTAWIQTGLLRSRGARAGSVSATGTATTTFTVTLGVTMPNATYKVVTEGDNALSSAVRYVTNKTTTTFDVVYLAGLTGSVAFDWILSP